MMEFFCLFVDPTSIATDILDPNGKLLVEFTLGTGRGNQTLDAAYTSTSPGRDLISHVMLALKQA